MGLESRLEGGRALAYLGKTEILLLVLGGPVKRVNDRLGRNETEAEERIG